MPVSADTKATAPFTYQLGDRSITFDVRFLSRRQRAEHRRLVAAVVGKRFEDEAVWDAIRKAVEVGIVGWSLSSPFSYDAMEDEIGERDIWRIAQQYVEAIDVTEDDLGKSNSQPAGRPESAAGTATTPASA